VAASRLVNCCVKCNTNTGVLFEAFGDRVADWMTFNEPWITCSLQVGEGCLKTYILIHIYINSAWRRLRESACLRARHAGHRAHLSCTQPPPPSKPPQWGNGNFAPGIDNGDAGKYACGHHLLLAHGQTVALYNEKFRAKQVRSADA
jgi:beta-glucosidase/6-phospho-beta-glucosidase/beta-galactosidase